MPDSLVDLPSADACVMHLLRHGATPPNLVDPPVMQGKGMDEPLAEVGREQAARAAGALSDRPLKAIYASPLRRAMETAGVVAERHGLPVQPVESLVEVEVGRWEGRSWPEIEREEPDAYRAFREDPGANGYPGGETMRELLDRVSLGLEQLMQRHVGDEIAVVAHSVVNRAYLGSLLGLSLAGGRRIPQANCAINVIRYREGRAKLITSNAIAHLM